MQQTVIIYTIKDANAYKFGRRAAHVLSKDSIPVDLSWTWVAVTEYVLPDGYEVAERADGALAIYKGEERCLLSSDKDDNPVILDLSTPGRPAYIRLARVRGLCPADDSANV